MATHDMVCTKCGKKYTVPISAANLMFFCPACHSRNGSLSDYGHGPIVPCHVYVGDHKIGEITGGYGDYHLRSEEFGLDVLLTKLYKNLEVYHEAEEIILSILVKEENKI